MSTPQSVIKVCSGVRLNNNYEHTIYFSNLTNQTNYFTSKVVKTFTAYTYLRKSWDINVEATMVQARQWSYLFFTNPDGKTYYYFINNIEYVNDNTVKLFIELDVMQTYLFDFSLLDSFVEREHTNDDSIGNNTIDEGLETGEFIVNFTNNVDLKDLCVLVMMTFDPELTTAENTVNYQPNPYNDVFSGLAVYCCEEFTNTGDDITDSIPYNFLSQALSKFDAWGKSDGVVAMWMYPRSLVQLTEGQAGSDRYFKRVSGIGNFNVSKSRRTDINGYKPKNNKLFTYPFNFLYVSNNSGGAGCYRFERFDNPSNAEFKVSGAITPEGATVLYPLNYNGAVLNYEEGLTLTGFPSCAWNQDIYKLWLAQNQNQHQLSAITAGVKVAAGAVGLATSYMTGGLTALAGGSGIISGVADIANLLTQKADKEIQPPQAKGAFSSSVNVANGFQTFTIQHKSVSAYYARIIDDFFSMYGYKTHRVKKPNTHVRENWTYTKTVGCHIRGNLCTDDLRKIESVFNNGVTFWANGDSIGDYSLSNNII